MVTSLLRRTTGLLLALLVLLGAPSRTRADDASDSRRAFRAAQRNKDWRERRAAFVNLLDWEDAAAVDAVFTAMAREKNAAVLIEGVKTLATFETESARNALFAVLNKPKGAKALYTLLAISAQKGKGGESQLYSILRGKDAQLAVHAALALGARPSLRTVDELIGAFRRKEWQVVSAAARALRRVAWSAWTKPTKPKEVKKPAMPEWFDPKKVMWPLIDALEAAKGAERGPLIETLESITGKDYGYNLPAWIALGDGKEVDEATLLKRVHPPYFCGVPIYGKRIVIVHDVNVRTDDAHPFTDRTRLQELCKVPGARDIPWYKLRTTQHFISAQTRRFIQDLPTRGVKFELIFSGVKPDQTFGKLTGSNGGTKKAAFEAIEEITVQNGNDVLGAMTAALDISGSKDSVAMTRGPDQIVCIYASVPWLAAETDPQVVGSAIGFKARSRGVSIHAVGVREFAYDMLRTFAGQTGGRYVAWIK